MSATHEAMVELIVATLEAGDGAGSDLVTGDRFGSWLQVTGNLDVGHLASDVIAAAAPSTITTTEELDALPMGSKVVSEGYEWTKNYLTTNTPSGGIEREVWFNVYDDFEASEDFALPATVLYEPQTDCCTADGPTCATCASYAAEDAEPQP